MKKSIEYNYDGELKTVHVIIFKFKTLPEYIVPEFDVTMCGGVDGLIVCHNLNKDEIISVEEGTMSEKDFKELSEWDHQ